MWRLLSFIITLLMISGEAGAALPNIVMVMPDDVGYGDFSCLGNPIIKTPNIDAIHVQSVRFIDFHVSPTCVRERAFLKKLIVAVPLAIYLAFIADITLFHFQGEPGVNLVPFNAIVRDVKEGGRNLAVNILGNLGVFLPLGFAMPILGGRATRAWHVALVGALLSTCIEVAQYRLGRRVADIDDVLMNTTGAVVGYAIYLISRLRR